MLFLSLLDEITFDTFCIQIGRKFEVHWAFEDPKKLNNYWEIGIRMNSWTFHT